MIVEPESSQFTLFSGASTDVNLESMKHLTHYYITHWWSIKYMLSLIYGLWDAGIDVL